MAGQATSSLDGGTHAATLLEHLHQPTRDALLGASTSLRVEAGHWLFRADDPGDSMYLVMSGRMEVVREAEGLPAEVLRVLGPGAVLGELALLTHTSRSASVRARRDAELLRLDSTDFERVMSEHPDLALALTRFLGSLLAGSGRQPEIAKPSRLVIAVVALTPTSSASMQDEVLAALRHVFGTSQVAVLNPDHGRAGGPDRMRVGDATNQGSVWAAELNRCEEEHAVVVLQSDATSCLAGQTSQWTQFCLRSADRVLAVAGPRAPPLFPTASALGALRGSDLCLLDDPEGSDVARWLRMVEPRRHHFVRTQTKDQLQTDVGRMVRRMSGRAVGVVLSGGGARGFAHLGVLQTLATAGVVVDRLGGCSMGSVIAALAAQQRPVADQIATCRRWFVESRPLNDYTIPRTSLVRGTKLRDSLRDAFGPLAIESLPLDFFCVSSDLIHAETVVHRRGPLWEAVLASVSIPGLVPPIRSGDRLLVDGGVLNNLPIDVMADAEEGPVVAVDVMRAFDGGRADREPRADGPSMTRSMFRLSSNRGTDAPAMAEILTRTTVLGSWRHTEAHRARASVVITLPPDGTGVLQFDRLDAMVETGRRAAEAALDDSALKLLMPNRHGLVG